MGSGTSPNKLALYQRCQEALEVLMEHNGYTTLTKSDFAVLMATRYGRVWLRGDGTGDRKLVEEVCNLTRDQDEDPYAKALFGGFVVAYASNVGGMSLIDPTTGDLPYNILAHVLAGDLSVQQKSKTTNRRRLPSWQLLGQQAMNARESDIARVAWQIEREIESTGYVSDGLIAEFIRLINRHGGQGQPA